MASGTGWVLELEVSWNSIQHNKVTTFKARRETTQLNWNHKQDFYILYTVDYKGVFVLYIHTR